MSDITSQGFDDAMEEVTAAEPAVTPTMGIVEDEQPKRKPFALWTVGNKDYRLKLRTGEVCKLEQKFNKNLLLFITGDGLPPLSVMLTVIQAGMVAFHHGITFRKVQDIYDEYVEEGGDQTKLLSEVLMPLMGVSGFFTNTQMDILTEEMKDLDSTL